MKKMMLVLLVLALSLTIVTSAFAAAPCNDTDGDGSSSGREYAQYHISLLATNGALGNGGHKPGVAHQGFSVCNPSGD